MLRAIQGNALYWLQHHTRTKNEHWKEEGFDGPYQPFPDLPYFTYLFKAFANPEESVVCVKKSRDMMASWCVVGHFTHEAMTTPGIEVILQSQKETKADDLVDMARTLWEQQDDWLKQVFPLAKAMPQQPQGLLEFANGSRLVAVPEGADQIRSHHPSRYTGDEVAYQPAAEDAYNNVLPVCKKIIEISSAGPGWFAEFTRPEAESKVSVMRGVVEWRNASGALIIWLHYTADPRKDPGTNPAWLRRERRKYTSQSIWDREQEIIDEAGGGERVFSSVIDEKRDLIVITDKDWRPSPCWTYFAGFDWGHRNPSSLHIFCIDDDGWITAIAEHYRSGLQPSEHAAVMRSMYYFDRVPRIYADPRIFDQTLAQAEGAFRSLNDLFVQAGIRNMYPGQKGEGLAVNKILEMWKTSPPRFRIVCPAGVSWERKREGTFNFACPNLLWELYHIRTVQFTATQLASQNPSERLVQRDNHAFDGLTYALLSEPRAAEVSDEVKWAVQIKDMRDRGKRPGINALAMMWRRQQAEKERLEVTSWR